MSDKTGAKVTKVSQIDWRQSSYLNPYVVINAIKPFHYRLACSCISDDGETIKVLPSLDNSINEMLEILEGCLCKESNFRTVLAGYYGDKVQEISQIRCRFEGIEVVINDKMTAWEAKIQWLRKGLNAGYKNLLNYMTSEERETLEKDADMKDLISKYERDL